MNKQELKEVVLNYILEFCNLDSNISETERGREAYITFNKLWKLYSFVRRNRSEYNSDSEISEAFDETFDNFMEHVGFLKKQYIYSVPPVPVLPRKGILLEEGDIVRLQGSETLYRWSGSVWEAL